jgi:hypothetical protein
MDVARLKNMAYTENKIKCIQCCVDVFTKSTLEKSERVNKNGQSRNIGNIGRVNKNGQSRNIGNIGNKTQKED